jgi:hypothetical protein
LGGLNDPLDFPPFRNSVGLGGNPPVDLVISTPATIGPLGLKPKLIDMFADIQTLVVEHRYAVGRRQLENVLMPEFRAVDSKWTPVWRQKTQHVFVATTLPTWDWSVDAVSGEKVSECQSHYRRGTMRDTTDSIKRRCGLIKIAKSTYGGGCGTVPAILRG